MSLNEIKVQQKKKHTQIHKQPKVSFWQKFINFTSVLGGIKLLYELFVEVIEFVKKFLE